MIDYINTIKDILRCFINFFVVGPKHNKRKRIVINEPNIKSETNKLFCLELMHPETSLENFGKFESTAPEN